MNRNTLVSRLLVFALLIPGELWAQGVQATLRGRVADSSGAAMSTVKIEVKNMGTNAAVSTATAADIASTPSNNRCPLAIS